MANKIVEKLFCLPGNCKTS